MREVSIKKLNDRHHVVLVDGQCVYEGIDRNSCLRYLRREKQKFLRKTARRGINDVSRA